jgi:NADH:ubiquinone oxidoreductase subunit 6 (subunit J)
MSQFPASQMIAGGVFLLCAATTIAGALIAALTARIIRSVCGLAICALGLAGLYYFLHSPFLALMEILIYVGAVCVTIVFAVMLAEPEEPVREGKAASTVLWGGFALVVCSAIFWSLWQLGAHYDWSAPATRITDGSVAAIGKSLLTTYSLAFELISLALLVAIIGALAVARTGRNSATASTVTELPAHQPLAGIPDAELETCEPAGEPVARA